MYGAILCAQRNQLKVGYAELSYAAFRSRSKKALALINRNLVTIFRNQLVTDS